MEPTNVFVQVHNRHAGYAAGIHNSGTLQRQCWEKLLMKITPSYVYRSLGVQAHLLTHCQHYIVAEETQSCIGHMPVWRDVPKSIQHMFIHVYTAISFPESSTRSSKVDQLTMDLAWRAHHSPGCLVGEDSLKRPVIHQISFMLEFLGYTECL